MRTRGFTLVELLVVIGIIGILLSLLMPAVSSARNSAKSLQCTSNMKRVAESLYLYRTSNRDCFPPNCNLPSPGAFWYDADRIGKYLPDSGPATLAGVKGGVLICPNDEGGLRSYAMNLWVSCMLDSSVVNANPTRGCYWRPKNGKSSQTILLVERWSSTGSNANGWAATAISGFSGLTPGPRFGAGMGLNPMINAGRFGMVNCELPFYRHRTGRGTISKAAGRINFAYVDGHVASKTPGELADPVTGLSTLDSRWSPMDEQLNQ
jgi:prepilin-type N-terminal cleavage/methylation domain-containing protein/prepilin-type processing-associated H-X9-DG protein